MTDFVMRKALILILAIALTACTSQDAHEGLRAELLEMASADQEVRERLNAVVTWGDPDSFRTQEAQRAIEEMAAVDVRNQIRLDEITSQFGWPSARLVGREAASAALLIIEHSDVQTKEQYLPLLRQAVEDGQEDSALLAQLEDEVSVANTGYQIYGTEISMDTGVPVLVPILNPEQLDARRARVGLQPMEEHLREQDRNALEEFGVVVDRSALSIE